jgi:hypothetical protein
MINVLHDIIVPWVRRSSRTNAAFAGQGSGLDKGLSVNGNVIGVVPSSVWLPVSVSSGTIVSVGVDVT